MYPVDMLKVILHQPTLSTTLLILRRLGSKSSSPQKVVSTLDSRMLLSRSGESRELVECGEVSLVSYSELVH